MTGSHLPLVPLALVLRGRSRHVRRARLRRHALAAARRAARLSRVHGDPRRALPCVRRSGLQRRPSLRLSRPAPDLGGVRDVRDGDVRRVTDVGHERRRFLPVHADAPGHADRPRGVGGVGRRGDDLRRRLRGGGHRRGQPVRRRRRPHVERCTPRPPARRDRRPGARCQHHERLHGGTVGREHDPPARSALGDDRCRRRRHRTVCIPRLREPRTDVDHAPRQSRSAARRRSSSPTTSS